MAIIPKGEEPANVKKSTNKQNKEMLDCINALKEFRKRVDEAFDRE